MRFSVVVPTLNRATLLDACVTSILEQRYDTDEFEVIVVDDGSTDATADVVLRLAREAGPSLRYVRQENGGLNRARNTGVTAARGEAVAFIDDDELLEPDYLVRAHTLLDEHPECAGVGGPAVDDGRARLRTCARCSLGSVSLPFDRPSLSERLLGGNMVIRRGVFDRVGLFAPTLSGRGDETEWFARADAKFFYDPMLFVWHRRDHMTFVGLCAVQFRQGRALPEASRLQGLPYRPRIRRVMRSFGHAAVHRCAHGLVLAARELGATWEWMHR